LYNLARGERRRFVDQVPDTEDPATRTYVEAQFWTPDGTVGELVRPGSYKLFVSRGNEYEIDTRDVVLKAGEITRVFAVLKKVVNSTGYVSGDMHLHSGNSIDSGISVRDRVVGVVGEGLDFAISTDHNFITDYAPYVTELDLDQWLLPIVGLEMTTLEVGHFNGYPLSYDLAQANRGAFEWYGRTAEQIFTDMRKIGKYGPEETIVQVNHPRDSLLGYFSQLSVDADTMDRPKPQAGSTFSSTLEATRFENWSLGFDALEIMNGKRWDLLRTVRLPEVLPPPPYLIPEPVVPGAILRYGNGEIAYPGAVDDWFKLLNRGLRFTGLADSDSHGNTYEEPGWPRTYVNVGADDPFEIEDLNVTRGIKARKATLSQGPFVELFVNEQPIGSDIVGTGAPMLVNVRARVQRPSWIKSEYLTFYINGEPARRHALRDVVDDTIEDAFVLPVDSYIVAEVVGESASLFPILTGWEEVPLTLKDAVAGIAAPLGITFADLGNLQPTLTRPVYPYAITNPIWIDVEGDGNWTPPGNAPPSIARRAARDEKPTPKEVTPPPQDIRALYKLFGGHH
jgi:hypothetical protein